jgi:streptogramin lyase
MPREIVPIPLAEGQTDERPGHYYVSAIDGRRWALLYGPLERHADAVAAVETARRVAVDADARAWFYAFGTARVAPEDPAPTGVLNHLLPPIGAEPPDAEETTYVPLD